MISLFPINIYKDTIQQEWNSGLVVQRLEQYFEQQRADKVIVRTLHKEPVFGPIVDFMNQSVQRYWQQLNYDPHYPVEISSMWANLMQGDDQFPYALENHSPAVISAVFYVSKDSPEMGNIYFANPLEHMLQTQPLSPERRFGNNYSEVDTRTGDILCFPSWLNHGVYPNTTDRKRYIVAADFELKGLRYIKSMMNKK